MKKRDHRILTQDNKKLAKRLKRRSYVDQPEPMFQPANLHYEMSKRSRGIGFGGIGALHTLVTRLGLDEAINQNVPLLKAHVPYFESDHVLNLAYNVLTGGTCLEDIDRLREDSSYAEGLSAEQVRVVLRRVRCAQFDHRIEVNAPCLLRSGWIRPIAHDDRTVARNIRGGRQRPTRQIDVVITCEDIVQDSQSVARVPDKRLAAGWRVQVADDD